MAAKAIWRNTGLPVSLAAVRRNWTWSSTIFCGLVA
jgi:hypothetical protein